MQYVLWATPSKVNSPLHQHLPSPPLRARSSGRAKRRGTTESASHRRSPTLSSLWELPGLAFKIKGAFCSAPFARLRRTTMFSQPWHEMVTSETLGEFQNHLVPSHYAGVCAADQAETEETLGMRSLRDNNRPIGGTVARRGVGFVPARLIAVFALFNWVV